MSDAVKAIVGRLARLQQFADLFQQELQEIQALVKAELAPGIVSPTSTSPEEMNTMLEALANQAGTTILKLQDTAGSVTQAYDKFIFGKASLFMHHLSNKVIVGGRGQIEINADLQQYEESATGAPADALKGWPEGFYRNDVTKELQLYIKLSDTLAFIYDGLPGCDGAAWYIDYTMPSKRNWLELADEEKANLVAYLNTHMVAMAHA